MVSGGATWVYRVLGFRVSGGCVAGDFFAGIGILCEKGLCDTSCCLFHYSFPQISNRLKTQGDEKLRSLSRRAEI